MSSAAPAAATTVAALPPPPLPPIAPLPPFLASHPLATASACWSNHPPTTSQIGSGAGRGDLPPPPSSGGPSPSTTTGALPAPPSFQGQPPAYGTAPAPTYGAATASPYATLHPYGASGPAYGPPWYGSPASTQGAPSPPPSAWPMHPYARCPRSPMRRRRVFNHTRRCPLRCPTGPHLLRHQGTRRRHMLVLSPAMAHP